MGKMKFTGLEVENIFAYRGFSRVDLSACTPERNLIVVKGRNGAGKTSLLNAIKLLFLGSGNDAMRRVTIGASPLPQKSYVTGQPGRWYGVFNTSTSYDTPARVALEWCDDDRKFRAERCFKREHTSLGFTETLSVTEEGSPVSDGESVLLGLIPKEVVPFFFFDGEQIQSIADSEIGREQVEIERLLGLSFVGVLTKEIDLYNKSRSRMGLPEDVQLDIVRQENIEREARAKADASNRARVALEEEIQQLASDYGNLDKERNMLRTGISEADRQRMVNRIEILETARDRLAGDIVEHLPLESPWLGNPALVRAAFASIEAHLSGGVDASLAVRLHHTLPAELVRRLAAQRPPVSLSEEQEKQFCADVQKALEHVGIEENSSRDPLFASLSPRKIKSLHERFLIWSQRGGELASAHADRLRSMRQMTREQQQAQRDLDEAEIASEEARKRFELLTLEMTALMTRSSDCVAEHTRHKIEEDRAQKEISIASAAVRALETEYQEVARLNRAYQLGLGVKQALQTYRKKRRAKIRSEVESRLNARVGMLLGPTQLIKSAKLDDQFHMTYQDEQARPVARASISAGMRQLVAMSMLWALKDVADRPLPVVIDTPLGRIDRENRALLMTEYFPQAGNPLVLLPTNSELSEQDYEGLADSIAARYEIQNDDGLNAKIVLAPPTNQGGGRLRE
jgi:DNA sulfur modification protein DndD